MADAGQHGPEGVPSLAGQAGRVRLNAIKTQARRVVAGYVSGAENPIPNAERQPEVAIDRSALGMIVMPDVHLG